MWVAVGVAVVSASSAYTAHEARDAAKEARQQAELDKAQALEAAQFADEEGDGIGQLGKINLSIDDTLDDDVRRQGKSNLSI